MQRYRKKPVEVNACQITDEMVLHHLVDEKELPFGLTVTQATYHKKDRTVSHWRLFIKTLEGNMTVSNGDYVIEGIQGELYPCKPDIFEATYELVT